MPKIVKAMVVRVILGVVSVLCLVTAGSTPDHKSLIPAQVLTTSLVCAHDHATLDVADDSDDGGFTRTSELSVGVPPLQLPPVDQTTVAGNSLNHYIIQMDGEHVRDQRCGHTTPTISTITSTTTTISNNLTGPTTSSSSSRTSTSRTSEIITGTNSSLSTISTNPTETSRTGEIITRTNSSLPTISTNSTETRRTSEIIIGTNSSLPTISTNPTETRTSEIITRTNSSLPTISTNSTETGSLNTDETPKEGQEEKDSFQLGRTLLGLTFEAAVALMVSRFQSLGNSSSPPSSSSSASPPRPPSSSLASILSSFPFAMVWATIVCGFTVTLIGVILRKAHSTAANLCNYAGIISVALGFFLMMEEMCIPEPVVWLVWAAAGILVIVFAYALARRSGKKE